jgi:hypothetical protein
MMAKTTGFDDTLIDTEHSSFDLAVTPRSSWEVLRDGRQLGRGC